eukprot:CAMPEP_0203962068 /NCGR_PEP_ID=MMETSP0359-20131031/92357_1 /ASSEMBLY_ACC=CAM_ASM_000338 /TAXON_ID=268821 /ORGANISM="Scrippsiella Hangoei, Strain SHTV-5" /LENGTH=313 /DNA_ID=CAMNT_0050897219 /DNA_START=66 /DNA_END=1007 /DNA_ORIENTATION=+
MVKKSCCAQCKHWGSGLVDRVTLTQKEWQRKHSWKDGDKTICREFEQKGYCHFGEKCNFFHDYENGTASGIIFYCSHCFGLSEGTFLPKKGKGGCQSCGQHVPGWKDEVGSFHCTACWSCYDNGSEQQVTGRERKLTGRERKLQTLTHPARKLQTLTHPDPPAVSKKQLEAAGFDTSQLKHTCNMRSLLAGFNAAELLSAGFPAAQLRATGFNARQLKVAGLGLVELKAAGFSAEKLSAKSVGFSESALRAAGFSELELGATLPNTEACQASGSTPSWECRCGFARNWALNMYCNKCNRKRPDLKKFNYKDQD